MKKYHYVFATPCHSRIEHLDQIKGWSSVLGLFKRDGRRPSWELGSGKLRQVSRKRKYLQTDAVGLHDHARSKGHGIHLYFALIHAAKSLGAKRLYSSKYLNNLSGNMWCNKLRQFDVVGRKEKRPCRCKCRSCRREWGRYYIDLTKIKLKEIPN